MTNKIIVSMSLPPLDDNKYVFKTYKVRVVNLFIMFYTLDPGE